MDDMATEILSLENRIEKLEVKIESLSYKCFTQEKMIKKYKSSAERWRKQYESLCSWNKANAVKKDSHQFKADGKQC